MIDTDEAKDWHGEDLVCDMCENSALSQAGKCQLRQACVQDRYAKRIDRFFDWNSDLAKDYLTHPYFEVRAVAAKHADVFHLPQLMKDPDETVRWSLAMRLPQRYLMMMRTDPDREVRIRVVARLDESQLGTMINDTDYYVRQVIARRISESKLVLLMHDPDPEVRVIVARRIGEDMLVRMIKDKEANVRLGVVRRLPPEQLHLMMNDQDWRVRYEVAERIKGDKYLTQMLNDEEPAIRELVENRLAQGDAGQGTHFFSVV